MKKRECAVVQDLLVLYEDGVLQEESMQMVEEHIRGCEDCMRIYENAGKDLRISLEETGKSEKEQEDAAAKVMKRVYRRITYKHIIILGLVVVLLLVGVSTADGICNRISGNFFGITGMIYTIPADEIEVTELYQLKNGDIYCTLKSDKQIGLRQHSDWLIPDNKYEEDTDEATQELCFRQRTPWELDAVESYQVTMIFATSRQGILEESGKQINQSCSEISYCGKTRSDKLVIWQRGQKVQEAPEDIERLAIQGYVRSEQLGKAIRECENLGWDSAEEIGRVYLQGQDPEYMEGMRYYDQNIMFQYGYEAVWVDG